MKCAEVCVHEAAGREDSFTLTAMTSSFGATQSETSCRRIFAVSPQEAVVQEEKKERRKGREDRYKACEGF